LQREDVRTLLVVAVPPVGEGVAAGGLEGIELETLPQGPLVRAPLIFSM